jgi:hypothetical protein
MKDTVVVCMHSDIPVITSELSVNAPTDIEREKARRGL